MWRELRRDSERYAKLGGWSTRLGFWVGATYRLGYWAHLQTLIVRVPALMLYRVLKLPWLVFLRVNICPQVKIGAGLCLIHPSNILIPGGVEIGEDCLVFHDVTLGTGPLKGLPRIGDRVDLYVGARVLGGITVGDGSMIGANCVVTRSVPAGCAVVTAPARVLQRALLTRDTGELPKGQLEAAAPAREG